MREHASQHQAAASVCGWGKHALCGNTHRSAKSGSHEAFYQYLDAKGCKGALHMSCVKCGKTFHMADSNAALFAKHLAQSEQFTLDAADTILYGICSDCKGK